MALFSIWPLSLRFLAFDQLLVNDSYIHCLLHMILKYGINVCNASSFLALGSASPSGTLNPNQTNWSRLAFRLLHELSLR